MIILYEILVVISKTMTASSDEFGNFFPTKNDARLDFLSTNKLGLVLVRKPVHN